MPKVRIKDWCILCGFHDFPTYIVGIPENSISFPDIDMSSTLTKTFNPNSHVISLPGFSLIDVDLDLNIDLASKLAEGGTGTIYRSTFKKISLISKYSFNEIAVKIHKSNSQEAIDLIKFEIAIMSSIPSHPNVIQFVGYSESPLAIVMKFYPTSLKSLLEGPIFEQNEELAIKVLYDIAMGMAHIHKFGVLHLDLKPRNDDFAE